MNLRKERNFTTAMFAPQQPYYVVPEVPTEPFSGTLPTYVGESFYYDNPQPHFFVPEHPHNRFGGEEIVYVVQEEPPMSAEESEQLGLYANILGSYIQNKGKSAASLQADIDYLKKLRTKFPFAKDIINRQIQKKRELKKVLSAQVEQESIRDKGYSALVWTAVALVGGLGLYAITRALR